MIGYMEVRVICDRHVKGSLKEKTRKKRATYVAAATAGHVVHDGRSINTISLKQLISCRSTKHMSNLLYWPIYDGRDLTLVVVYITQLSRPSTHGGRLKHTRMRKLTHVILSIEGCTCREVNVWSPDTDILVILVDLVTL